MNPAVRFELAKVVPTQVSTIQLEQEFPDTKYAHIIADNLGCYDGSKTQLSVYISVIRNGRKAAASRRLQ